MNKPPYNYDAWMPNPVKDGDEWVYPGYICEVPIMDTLVTIDPLSDDDLTYMQSTALMAAEQMLQDAINRRLGVEEPQPVPPTTPADTNVSDYVKAAWSVPSPRPEPESPPTISAEVNVAAFVREKWA